jgi:predicted ATPase
VLFIDDLQWGDVDSAAALANLVQPPDAPPLLLLIAYRSEYLTTSPSLETLSRLLQAASVDEVRIPVDALTPGDARDLALALLGDRPDAAREADWVVRESGGSALFVYELVDYLESGESTGRAPELDHVLRLRVARLPELTRRLLEVIAVAARPVRIEDAQTAAHLPPLDPQVIASLRASRLVRTMGTGPQGQVETFHDRIRESIVAHLPPQTAQHHHAGLAASLELTGRADPETLAAHFEGADDHERASYYCERAAIEAVQVLAFDRAEILFKRALALTSLDAARVRLSERLIHFYTDLARFDDAYAVMRQAVEPLGVRLPVSFAPPLFMIDLVRAWRRLRGRAPRELIDLPAATDERLLYAVRLMNAGAKAAYQIRPELCVAVAAKIVNLCLRHGNTPDCAVGYMVIGCIFQGGVLGRYRAGYDFGRLALDLVDRYGNRNQRAEVHFVVGYFGTSWLRPAREAEALWRTAYDAGLETGDLFHTGCAAAATTMSWFMRGVPLADLDVKAATYLDVLQRSRLREPAGVVTALRQVIRNLRGETRGRNSLSDETFDEETFAREAAGFGSRHFEHIYYVARLQVLYLWGDYDGALQAAARSAACLKSSPGMLHSAEHHFYMALLQSATGRAPRAVRGVQRRYAKWATRNAENFLARSQILAGEVARQQGRFAEAAGLHTTAAAAAASFGQQHLVALASQLAARAFVSAGNAPDAARCQERAIEAWNAWGATAYAQYLSSAEAAHQERLRTSR